MLLQFCFLFAIDDRLLRIDITRRDRGRIQTVGMRYHTGLLSMDIHRYVSTCFEQPSVDIGLDLSPRGSAQANEGFLDAVLGPI